LVGWWIHLFQNSFFLWVCGCWGQLQVVAGIGRVVLCCVVLTAWSNRMDASTKPCLSCSHCWLRFWCQVSDPSPSYSQALQWLTRCRAQIPDDKTCMSTS
jgi:hypothetical protein